MHVVDARVIALPAIVFLVTALSAGAASARASFEILPLADGPFSDYLFTLDLSADGQTVVGSERVEYSPGRFRRVAARWDAGRGLTRLSSGEIRYETPFGISADGSTIVGRFPNAAGTATQAGLLREGEPLLNIGPEGANTTLSDVSADGSVAIGGWSPVNDRIADDGFIWDATNGVRYLSDLTGLSGSLTARALSDDGRIVVGRFSPDSGGAGGSYSWSETTGFVPLGPPSGGLFAAARAISGDGTTIVGSSSSGQGSAAAAWRDGVGVFLPAGDANLYPLGGGEPRPGTIMPRYADAASVDGSVIIGAGEMNIGASEPFIHYAASNTTRSIKDVLVEGGVTELDNWHIWAATNISADGRTITGWVQWRGLLTPIPEEYEGFSGALFAFRAVIPEPSTALLLGLGLVTLGTNRRR